MEAHSVNRREAQSAKGSTSGAKLQRELRLARLKLKQLELEAETAKRISEIKDEIVKELSDYNCCFASEPLLPPTTPPGERLKIVHDYVMSLPGSKTRQEDQITLNGPGIRVLPAESREFDRVSETAGLLQACMSLPARRSVTFDGNPMGFMGFMRNFQSTVARFNNDPAYLLDYLISACEGEPAEAIRRCTVLMPQEGYDKAIRIPERRFGKPHVIARKCIDDLSDSSVLEQTVTKARTVSLAFTLLENQEVIQVRQARAVENLPKLRPLNLKQDSEGWGHLQEVPMPAIDDYDIRILIGA
ncbi:Nek6 NIMA kinase 6, partial [Fasciola hepatica]